MSVSLMSSYLFIDTETTALGPNAAVIELAAIPYIDGEYLSHFQTYIAPHIGASMDPKAFEVNGIDPKIIHSFPPAHEAIKSFIEWVDSLERKFTISGHNVKFDKEKLKTLFNRTANYGNFNTRFRTNSLCTMELAKEIFKGKRKKPEGFSLSKLCTYFDIEISKAHSALPDIQATVHLYEELKKLKVKDLPKVQEMSYQKKIEKYMAMDYLTINPEGDIYIHCKATRDPIAMQFILSEVYDITVGDL